MRDFTSKELEEGRPDHSAAHCVNFCLKCLYADRDKEITDRVAHDLTFEELIGALLIARDELIDDYATPENYDKHVAIPSS